MKQIKEKLMFISVIMTFLIFLAFIAGRELGKIETKHASYVYCVEKIDGRKCRFLQ